MNYNNLKVTNLNYSSIKIKNINLNYFLFNKKQAILLNLKKNIQKKLNKCNYNQMNTLTKLINYKKQMLKNKNRSIC